jgi:hypothetical protein
MACAEVSAEQARAAGMTVGDRVQRVIIAQPSVVLAHAAAARLRVEAAALRADAPSTGLPRWLELRCEEFERHADAVEQIAGGV